MHAELSEIKFDEIFIKKLLEKLKVGNTRSIHLNALPGRSKTRLDLFQLSEIEKDLPEKFIDILLNKEAFSLEISYEKIDLGELEESEKTSLTLLSKKLNNIVIENDDNFLEFWIKNFGFGYPILIKRDKNDPTKLIKAPLFIWDLDIERHYYNKNTWTIKRSDDYSIKLNELLIAHLSKDESIHIEKISSEILEDGILDESELLKLCGDILLQLNIKTENLNVKIERCLDAKQIEWIANSKPWIQWSGIFGIYLSQKETIIQSTEELLERIEDFQNEDLILEKFQTSTISAIETDPSKDEIINTLTKNEVKLIQWPPGTGKSQSITAIIVNALANGAKCLIVCEKKTALDIIQKNLENIGLGDFSILIDDVNKDRKKAIEKARNINELENNSNFSDLEFREKYKNYTRIKEDLNKKYSESLKNVFGDYSWKYLIGLYLRFSKLPYFDQLITNLKYDDLDFNHEEYTKYINFVEEAWYLYEEVESKSEIIFLDLKTSIFSEWYKWGTSERVLSESKKIWELLASINVFLWNKTGDDFVLNPDFGQHLADVILSKAEYESGDYYGWWCFPSSIFKIDQTLQKSPQNFFLTVKEIEKYLEEIICLYEQGNKIIGNKFHTYDPTRNIVSITKLFGKGKQVFEINNKIILLLSKVMPLILEIHDEPGLYMVACDRVKTPWLAYELSVKLLEDTRKNIAWIKKVIGIEAELSDYEWELNAFLRDSLFDFEVLDFREVDDFKSLQQYYVDFAKNISSLQGHMDAYEDFHNWKFFASKCSQGEHEMLWVLKQVPPKDWLGLFKAWYYRWALMHYEENSVIGFNKSDKKLQQLIILQDELKTQQINQIKHLWGSKRTSYISSLGYSFNILYNLWKNKTFKRRNSLRKIVEIDFGLFTSLFPVVLTNPSAVNSIFPLRQGLFEIVIFDEASQLRISDTFTSLIRWQYKIIAGDKHQMPPSNYFQWSAESLEIEDSDTEEWFVESEEQSILAESESLLEFAEDLKNTNRSYLDYHYRSEHPALIEFSNCAFYGGNLISFPYQEVYKPIEFRAVNGRYEVNTNPKEVEEIINILKHEIHPNQNGTYPSVGIATFNINQRNLITEAINIVSGQDLSFWKKLYALKEKGLFIKNLENIQGDERDIIIISTTYGIKTDGKFSQNFARLNRIEWYKLLNVLITRAKKKVFVCTSIPKEKYLSYADSLKTEGNNKRGILYAYLTYAEAISNHDYQVAEFILKTLKEQSYEKPRAISQNDGLSESPFEEEVYEELLVYINKEKIIQQHKVGGFRLDFVIKAKSRDIVLECDGKTYHQSEEAHAHDLYRQKELENMGYIVYRIWSTNWFQNKEKEMKQFLLFLENFEG